MNILLSKDAGKILFQNYLNFNLLLFTSTFFDFLCNDFDNLYVGGYNFLGKNLTEELHFQNLYSLDDLGKNLKTSRTLNFLETST